MIKNKVGVGNNVYQTRGPGTTNANRAGATNGSMPRYWDPAKRASAKTLPEMHNAQERSYLRFFREVEYMLRCRSATM